MHCTQTGDIGLERLERPIRSDLSKKSDFENKCNFGMLVVPYVGKVRDTSGTHNVLFGNRGFRP